MTIENEVMTPGQILDDQLREQGCYALVVPRRIDILRDQVDMEIAPGKWVLVTYRPGLDLYDVELLDWTEDDPSAPEVVSSDGMVYADELVPIIRARLHEHWA